MAWVRGMQNERQIWRTLGTTLARDLLQMQQGCLTHGGRDRDQQRSQNTQVSMSSKGEPLPPGKLRLSGEG